MSDELIPNLLLAVEGRAVDAENDKEAWIEKLRDVNEQLAVDASNADLLREKDRYSRKRDQAGAVEDAMHELASKMEELVAEDEKGLEYPPSPNAYLESWDQDKR